MASYVCYVGAQRITFGRVATTTQQRSGLSSRDVSVLAAPLGSCVRGSGLDDCDEHEDYQLHHGRG
jgi:hypothetical protein